jgi:predicted DNA-binding protein YlxM (UPF0122 family)
MFQTEVVEKIKTCFMLSNFFFENLAVYEMWETNGTARQATDDNMTHAQFILDT